MRPFEGAITGEVLVDGDVDLLRLVFELFLRSIKGIDGLPPAPELGVFLIDRLSKILLISDGIGTE